MKPRNLHSLTLPTGWGVIHKFQNGKDFYWSLLGRYWFPNGDNVPSQYTGHCIACFKTRELARKAIKEENTKNVKYVKLGYKII